MPRIKAVIAKYLGTYYHSSWIAFLIFGNIQTYNYIVFPFNCNFHCLNRFALV